MKARQYLYQAVPNKLLCDSIAPTKKTRQMTERSILDSEYVSDVTIIGAGMLGLLNALQLSKRGLRVTLIDNAYQKRSYKVGESLLIFTNAFLRTIGELDDFLDTCFPKQGVWFCYGAEGAESFTNSTEWAFESVIPDRWADAIQNKKLARTMFRDVQIVRPEAEDRMREAVRSKPNIRFLDSALVRDVEFNKEGFHSIFWRAKEGSESGQVSSRWLLDCSGRARFLASRLGHAVNLGDSFQTTALWAQFGGISDDDFGDEWSHSFDDRDPVRRDYNTCHLWGCGYWIWVIRLSEGRVSIGVTFSQSAPPDGDTPLKQFQELTNRYPLLSRALLNKPMLEFRMYRNVQYISDTYVSEKRYGIVGDAASIIDAYYSQGISLALSTSWHFANIVCEDLDSGHLDTDYIDRVNESTLEDWRMMRNMIKGKFSSAIADSRYFILTHVLDYCVFAAALNVRYRLSRWLAETSGDPARETTRHRKMRSYLSRRMFFSRMYPWHWLGANRVQKLQDRAQRGLAARGMWRLANGVHLNAIRCITGTTYPIPRLWLLPFLKFGGRSDISGGEIIEPPWLRIKGTEEQPVSIGLAGPALLFLFIVAYAFDWIDTESRRLRRYWFASKKA
jgi:2-polyprenyl-6-methoxyphenol hydroxylase-like FAD-dependent oxidoreductase